MKNTFYFCLYVTAAVILSQSPHTLSAVMCQQFGGHDRAADSKFFIYMFHSKVIPNNHTLMSNNVLTDIHDLKLTHSFVNFVRPLI